MENFQVVNSEYEHLSTMFKIAEELAADNIEYFAINEEISSHTDFVKSFHTIYNIVSPLQISLDVIIEGCVKYDLNPNCKGNGYRSIITIVESCLSEIINISQQVQRNRDKLFFRSYQMYAEAESYSQLLTRLLTLVQFAIILMENSEDRWLFPEETPKVTATIEDLLGDFNNISRDCFYGRTFGFQYSYSVRHILQMIAVTMAAYGDGYIRHTDTLSRAVSSVIHSGKYIIDPDLRAKRIAELSQNINIDFCKAFWSLTEEYGVQHAPLLVCPAMDVNLEFTIPSNDLKVTTLSGEDIVVKFPSFVGVVGVKARLLSSVWRDGQLHNVWKESSSYGPLGPKPRQRSRYLMFHCHGGGFVAQSSKSHEIYLRYWAKDLRIPILSIDYSLSPEAAFPQALNEIFFAYVWALNNFKKLGTTGEKIVFTGDSAGGCLITAALFKAIMHNIRLPDSMVVAYPPYRVQYYPSPSRILCLMDPLLPMGVLKSCILAYVGGLRKKKSVKKVDLLRLTSHEYNPFELDFGDDHWDVCQSHSCGEYRSLSETNLDMIKSQLNPLHGFSDDEEYFSDCKLSNLENSASGKVRRSKSHLDVSGKKTSKVSSENVVDKKDNESVVDKKGNESVLNRGSLLESLRSQVSLQVFDFTSRVSTKVLDDIKSSVPPHVLDASSKVFNDIKTGFTNYLYEKGTSNSIKVPDAIIEEHDAEIDDSDVPSRKRVSEPLSPSISEESIESSPSFTICKECLYPSASCNCNMAWSGKIGSTQKQVLSHYGSRHRLSKTKRKCKDTRRNTIDNSICFHLQGTSRKKSSIIECNEGCSSDADVSNGSVPQLDDSSCTSNIDLCASSTSTVPGSSDSAENSAASTSSGTFTESDDIAGDFRNPLMSPIFAGPELLTKMPPTSILACSLDPLFDDSVDFIRKMQDLNKEAELYVLDRLPHGFLSFHMFSSEAHEACDLMVACIRKSLHMGMGTTDSSTAFSNLE